MITALDPNDLALAYVLASRVKAERIAIAINAIRRSSSTWDANDADITTADVRNRAIKDISQAIALARKGDFPVGHTLSSGFCMAAMVMVSRHYCPASAGAPAGESFSIDFSIGGALAYVCENELAVAEPVN